MRHSTLIALCLGLLGCLLAPQTAEAQAWTNGECSVSIWWPYSRSPGDCLTDGERKAGATGTYHDPDGALMRIPVAARALQSLEGCEASAGPEPTVASISTGVVLRDSTDTRITITGANFRCNSQAYFNAVPVPTVVVSPTQLEMMLPQELAGRDGSYPIVVRNRTPVTTASLGQQNLSNAPSGQGAPAPAAAPQAPAATNARGCNTSILWPYFREPGDCLTDAEREAGMVGVYGNTRAAGDPAPDPSSLSPLPASSDSGGIFGLFGSGSDFGGGGLLDDNLLPAQQGNQ